MSRPSAARTALLDAAERLFAAEGIATVSDRRIAEAAGNSNHSAVGYYFGGRHGLLEALISRHLGAVEESRRAIFEQSDSLLGDIRALVVPATNALADLPRPSHRARFIRQAMNDPAAFPLWRSAETTAQTAVLITRSIVARLGHLHAGVVTGRATLMAQVVTNACAEVEARAERDGTDPRWHDVGAFLSDALAGMLAAPVTNPLTANPLTETPVP